MPEKAIAGPAVCFQNSAGIAKQAGCHPFRHSFATHLADSGHDIRRIKELMGHEDINTTMIYLHLSEEQGTSRKSPYDSLFNAEQTGREANEQHCRSQNELSYGDVKPVNTIRQESEMEAKSETLNSNCQRSTSRLISPRVK